MSHAFGFVMARMSSQNVHLYLKTLYLLSKFVNSFTAGKGFQLHFKNLSRFLKYKRIRL